MSSKITAFNSLVTPSPHHIPGYGGYIPQRKYKIGGSFSKTTHEILGDKNNSSGNLVLRKIKPVQQKTPDHHSNLVPGYTGYIPKGEHYFGLPYVTACSYAKGELIGALKQDAISQRMNRDNLIRQVPLSPIRSSAEPYVGATRRNPSKSSTLDYHISGYTGFLPMSRNKISMGYPSMTQEAISDYRDFQVQEAAMQNRPFSLDRAGPAVGPETRAVLYPAESGMVPHYTGHIPGEKFKYGNTFGASTNAALKTMMQCSSKY